MEYATNARDVGREAVSGCTSVRKARAVSEEQSGEEYQRVTTSTGQRFTRGQREAREKPAQHRGLNEFAIGTNEDGAD